MDVHERSLMSDNDRSQLRQGNDNRLGSTRALSDSGFLSNVMDNSICQNDFDKPSKHISKFQNPPSSEASFYNSTPTRLAPKSPFLQTDALKAIKHFKTYPSRVPSFIQSPLNDPKDFEDNKAPSRKRIRVEDDNNNISSYDSPSIVELERQKGYHLEKYFETKVIFEYLSKNQGTTRPFDSALSDQAHFTDSLTTERQQAAFRSFSQSTVKSNAFQNRSPVISKRTSLFSKEKEAKKYEEVPFSPPSSLEEGLSYFTKLQKSSTKSTSFAKPTFTSPTRREPKADSPSKTISFAEWKRKRQDEEATQKYRNAIDQTLAQREKVRKALSDNDIEGLLDAYVPKPNSETTDEKDSGDCPVKTSNVLEEELKKQAVYRSNFLEDLKDKYTKREETVNDKIQTLIRQKEECHEENEKRSADYHKQMLSIAALARQKYQEQVASNLQKEEEEYEKIHPMEEEPEEEEDEEVVLPEITEEMDQIIRKALSLPGRELINAYSIPITSKDVVTFTGLRWLNDEVINFYMQMIVARSNKEEKDPKWNKVYAMTTFFYPKLRDQGYNAVKRWTRKVDIFAHDMILVPVHLGNHWCLATIDFKKKGIFYYDSMGSPNNECIRTLLDYIIAEHQDKKKEALDVSDYRGENVAGIPQQDNMSDCGMFTCKNAEYLSRNATTLPVQEDMPYFRRRIIYEVVTNTLLHP